MTGSDLHDSAGGPEPIATAGGPSTPPLPRSAAALDFVDHALANALEAATAAGRFDVVSQLARELEARRLAREPNVVRLRR